MKKLMLTALLATLAFTAYAGEGKKCDPATCKDKACAEKKASCKDGKNCKDMKACEGPKKEKKPA